MLKRKGADPAVVHIGGEPYRFECCLVDPPRAGLDHKTCRHLRRYRWILYISCCPASLLRDLADLSGTHSVTRSAIFDHFPNTQHLETAVLLEAGPNWSPP